MREYAHVGVLAYVCVAACVEWEYIFVIFIRVCVCYCVFMRIFLCTCLKRDVVAYVTASVLVCVCAYA